MLAENLVVFNRAPLKPGCAPDHLAREGAADVAKQLVADGFSAAFMQGYKALQIDNESRLIGAGAHLWTPEGVAPDAITLAPSQLTAVRDLATSLGSDNPEYDNAQKAVYANQTIVVNSRSVREFERKSSIINTLWQPATVAVVGGDLSSAIEAVKSDKMVAKPDKGKGSQGVFFIDKNHKVSEPLLEAVSSTDYVIQERVAHNGALTETGLIADSVEGNRLIDSSNRNKQLRVCYFFGDGVKPDNKARAFLRVATPKLDDLKTEQKIGIDQNSVPDQIWQAADGIFKQVADASGAEYIFGICDFIYGHTDNDPVDRWYVLELNLWKPAGIPKEVSPELARDLVVAQANLLGAASLRGAEIVGSRL